MFLQTGCTSHHVPNPGAIDLPDFPKSDKKISLNVINAQMNSNEIEIGRYGAGTLVGDLKTWSGTAVEIVQKSLEKEGVNISDNSSKSLKLAVNDAKVDAAGVEFVASLARCKISLKVETGGGYSQMYEESNLALNPPWACDAAMKSVVTSLLKDKTILEYFNQ